MTFSKPNYLPKALSPITTTPGIRASTYEFGGHASIRSITVIRDFDDNFEGNKGK